jgi:hypothetical protein
MYEVKITSEVMPNFIKVCLLHGYSIDEVKIMPVDRYRGVSLQRELVDKIEEYVKNHPETGYKSMADFITDALRKRCEELKILVPTPPELPTLEHLNVKEDHVTVIDRAKKIFADVYFRNSHVFCEACESENCEHVKYALGLPKIQKVLREKGWVIEEGKIIRKPY